ncbi:MAG TPA: ATP-binding protein [Rummeliibacillus sp.]|nr:ATP-binding protein [Rummeliibacillus sp.]
MSKSILIIGESGSGKSTSIRTLDPTSTYIINVIGKDLPFKGASKLYKQQEGGNLYKTDNPNRILHCLRGVSEHREDIKTIIIDDFQYVMSNEYMERIHEKTWSKFDDIASGAFSLLEGAKTLRDDIIVIFLSHCEKDDDGFIRFRSIGKLVNKFDVEGRFTLVLLAKIQNGNYYFKTNSDGESTCKSPMGMFEEKLIPNDLQYVIDKIKEF